MTRKDFQLIADAIRAVADDEASDKVTAETLAYVFADRLRSTNPRFNRDRFLSACGIDN